MKSIITKKYKNTNIHLVQGDITELASDCIVNAAHEALMGGGGVDGAIHRKAGPELLQACREIPEQEKGVRCKVGEAYITKAFNLPSKFVIHTVAPKWVGSIIKKKQNDGTIIEEYKSIHENVDKQLRDCYECCIQLAHTRNVTSIAFPSLGTGGHSYPIELASKIALNTIINQINKGTTIENIYFVCFSEYDTKQYEQVFNLFKSIQKQGWEQDISELQIKINDTHKQLQEMHNELYKLNEDFYKWLKENNEHSTYLNEMFYY